MKKTTAIVDCRISSQSIEALKGYGFSVIAIPPFSRLSEAVSSHPDMIFFLHGDSIVCHRDYAKENPKVIEQIRKNAPYLSIIETEANIGCEYPHDILFNAFLHEGHLFCRMDSVSSLVKDDSYEHHNVKQGYAACSCCSVGRGVITADRGLAKSIASAGFPVLSICEGHISLPCHDYGFIGGASGYCDGVVYFNGDISLHPNASEILDFCREMNAECVCLNDGKLHDVGKILFI